MTDSRKIIDAQLMVLESVAERLAPTGREWAVHEIDAAVAEIKSALDKHSAQASVSEEEIEQEAINYGISYEPGGLAQAAFHGYLAAAKRYARPAAPEESTMDPGLWRFVMDTAFDLGPPYSTLSGARLVIRAMRDTIRNVPALAPEREQRDVGKALDDIEAIISGYVLDTSRTTVGMRAIALIRKALEATAPQTHERERLLQEMIDHALGYCYCGEAERCSKRMKEICPVIGRNAHGMRRES